MKKIAFYLLLSFCSITIYGQEEKIYTLAEVEKAPKFKKGKELDSLTSHQNFKRNLKIFIFRNLDLLEYNSKKIRVYVEFLIDEKGKVSVLRVRGKSDKAKILALEVIEKIKKLNPAKVNGESVNMKHIIPITFNPTIHIDRTKNN
jgi:hypothetical protein